jgi:hypothetical protein
MRRAALYWNAAKHEASRQGWSLLSLELRNADDISAVIERASVKRVGAVLVSHVLCD